MNDTVTAQITMDHISNTQGLASHALALSCDDVFNKHERAHAKTLFNRIDVLVSILTLYRDTKTTPNPTVFDQIETLADMLESHRQRLEGDKTEKITYTP